MPGKLIKPTTCFKKKNRWKSCTSSSGLFPHGTNWSTRINQLSKYWNQQIIPNQHPESANPIHPKPSRSEHPPQVIPPTRKSDMIPSSKIPDPTIFSVNLKEKKNRRKTRDCSPWRRWAGSKCRRNSRPEGRWKCRFQSRRRPKECSPVPSPATANCIDLADKETGRGATAFQLELPSTNSQLGREESARGIPN